MPRSGFTASPWACRGAASASTARRFATKLLAVALGLALLAPASVAEVSGHRQSDWVSTLIIVGIIVDDPNPIGIWHQYRQDGAERVLNSDGDLRGDGRPDVFYGPDGWPLVVWSYRIADDHDVAISGWVADGWGPTEFLTSTTENHLDPRVFREPDGTIHVVWWTEGAVDEVQLMTREPVTPLGWNVPRVVSEPIYNARRPTVVVHEGQLMIAFERNELDGEGQQEVVVGTLEDNDSFTYTTVATTPRNTRLDPILHSERGQLWLDWIQDTSNLGCSQRQGNSWTPLALEPLVEDTWLGLEMSRRLIRGQVLTP